MNSNSFETDCNFQSKFIRLLSIKHPWAFSNLYHPSGTHNHQADHFCFEFNCFEFFIKFFLSSSENRVKKQIKFRSNGQMFQKCFLFFSRVFSSNFAVNYAILLLCGAILLASIAKMRYSIQFIYCIRPACFEHEKMASSCPKQKSLLHQCFSLYIERYRTNTEHISVRVAQILNVREKKVAMQRIT